MGKRRNAKNHHPSRGVGSNSRIIAHGDGDTGKKDELSVFDFGDEDERVEMDSRRSLSKFKNKSPSKKPAHCRPLDKYDFLSFFTRGPTSSQNNSETKPSVIDVGDDVFQDRTVRPDVSISYDSSSYRLMPKFSQNHSGGEKSYSYGKGKSGGCATGKNHNKVLYIESDDDGMMEMRSTTSSFDLIKNKGSVEELSSEHGINANDCEAVVVVAPTYAKYGNVCYAQCFLTFSQRCIRLEGSPLCEKKGHHCLEWSICDILKIECRQSESVKAEFVNLHFKLKDSNVAVTHNFNSDIVELEFVVTDDSQWSNKQEEIESLDLKYKAAWKTITCGYSSSMAFAFEDVIYPEGDPDAVFISRRDVELLQPRTFINDTIIDFYMKYLLNKIKPEGQHRFHVFNTFFFRKLADLDRDSCRAWDGKEAFQRVRKWTRNVNLFEKDYILIPVNFSLHWSLIVICHPRKVANLREDVGDPAEVPCVLHMDSIRGSHRGFENLIRSYLWEEWKERHNKQEASMKFLNLQFVALKVPQQENLFDCGLFLLHYAELFLELATNFSTTRYSDVLNEDLFLPAEVSLKKRERIRNLIHRIVGDNALKDLAACNDTCFPRDQANEGDSGVKFVKEINVKDTCHDIKFNSSIDQEIDMTSVRTTPISGQQYLEDMLEPGNAAKPVDDKSFKPCERLVSINQFRIMRLPVEEETLEKQDILLPGYTGNRHEADDNDISMPAPYPLSNFRTTEMEVQCRSCTMSAVSPPIIIDLQNDEVHVPEVESTTEKEKNECKYYSISSEDLAACVVEDSEEEKETQSLSKTRRHLFSTVPVILPDVN